MNEKLLVLQATLDKDQAEIARLFGEVSRYEGGTLSEKDKAIVLGYLLHNLYSAFENTFKTIANTFENQIRDASQWHAELLQRMAMDIPGLRPRFVPQEILDPLDELRRFRHVFRSAYMIQLDLKRVALVLEKAHELEQNYLDIFERFRFFLKKIGEGK